MQHLIFKQTLLRTFTLLPLCLILFAFTAPVGLDSYEIYLNKKLLVKEYALKDVSLKSLQLDNADANDQLVVYYTHCNNKAAGTGRSIAIKDEKGRTLKEWKFEDASGSKAGMIIPVKELQQLEKNNANSHLTIYYAATELPEGRLLAAL